MITYAGNITLFDSATISDPCYKIGTGCTGKIDNVRAGIYKCFYKLDKHENRVSAIQVVHSSLTDEETREADVNFKLEPFEVGVDSGMAGIFNSTYFSENHTENDIDEQWYGRVCHECNHAIALDNRAFISESGFGDGGYDCFVHRNEDGFADSIKIVYYDENKLYA